MFRQNGEAASGIEPLCRDLQSLAYATRPRRPRSPRILPACRAQLSLFRVCADYYDRRNP
jgi:hypothetical protein